MLRQCGRVGEGEWRSGGRWGVGNKKRAREERRKRTVERDERVEKKEMKKNTMKNFPVRLRSTPFTFLMPYATLLVR